MKNLGDYCLGHITKNRAKEGWCPSCKYDEKNTQCPYYKPVRILVEENYEPKIREKTLTPSKAS